MRGSAVAEPVRGVPERGLQVLRRSASEPWLVAALVLVLYAVSLFAAYHNGRDARWFIKIGQHFVLLSHASPEIRLDPRCNCDLSQFGYDGQFSYYIALDPEHARYYMDDPAYRYGRILYPAAARVLALGRSDLVPDTLILINLLALAGGTLALAVWLRRSGFSPWPALLFGLYPGLFVSLQRDLTEPLAYALVALGIYLFDAAGRRRLLWAGISFGLAALARETTLVFAGTYALGVLLGGSPGDGWRRRVGENWTGVVLFLDLALIPTLLYRGFLFVWLGQVGVPASNGPTLIPLQGLFASTPHPSEHLTEAFCIVLPGLICLALGAWAVVRGGWTKELGALLLCDLLFVVFLNGHSYEEFFASGRIAGAVVLAALLSLPRFLRLSNGTSGWLWTAALLCYLPWYALLPLAGGS